LLSQLADKAQAALTKDPLHPDKVASTLGVQNIAADNIGAGEPIPGVGVNKELDESVSSLKKGEVSPAVSIPGNKAAVAVCTADTPAHPAAFQEVESKVRDTVVKEKLSHLVDEKANQLLEKARANGGDLAAAAKAMGLEVKTSEPVDRAGAIEGLGSAGMFPDAFTKPAGTLFGPSSLADAKVVGKVVEKMPADMGTLASQMTSIRDQIKSQKGQSRSTLFEEGVRDALTKEGKVKIHQDVVNRMLANYHG